MVAGGPEGLKDEGGNPDCPWFGQADESYTAEIEPLFGKVRCPVIIIWGEEDPWIPLARGKVLHRLIPHASFETLPHVGHLP